VLLAYSGVVATFETTVLQLAREIRKRRRALGKTQEEVAFSAQVSVRHFQQLESGSKNNPRLQTLYNVALALDWSLIDLLRPRSSSRRPADERQTK